MGGLTEWRMKLWEDKTAKEGLLGLFSAVVKLTAIRSVSSAPKVQLLTTSKLLCVFLQTPTNTRVWRETKNTGRIDNPAFDNQIES